MPWKITNQTETSFDAELAPFSESDVWNDAYVKWDGCVHYRRYFNAPKGEANGDEENACYLHLCSVAEEVDHFLTLAEIAKEKIDSHGYWEKEAEKIRAVLLKHGWAKP